MYHWWEGTVADVVVLIIHNAASHNASVWSMTSSLLMLILEHPLKKLQRHGYIICCDKCHITLYKLLSFL